MKIFSILKRDDPHQCQIFMSKQLEVLDREFQTAGTPEVL